MTEDKPINYSDAHSLAEINQRRATQALPQKLAAKEDRFLQKIKQAKVGPLNKLEMLYEMMEELSAVTSKFTPCKKGCSSCCHYKVSISEIEIEYIEKSTRHRRNRHPGEIANFHCTPCPFLKNGSCSIYEARPFVCRRHHAFMPNAYWCHPDRSDQDFPFLSFTSINGAFDEIRLQTNAGKLYDIRQVFA
jgi:Fe-S-cluster containining protein